MIGKWDWQRDRQQVYKQNWQETHKEHHRLYIEQYREDHPESTRRQRLKDWKLFAQRSPERWKEIHNRANRRYRARQKAIRKAELEALRQEEGIYGQ